MVVDERARHALHTRLEKALGPEEATTLMSLLPPVGWADVATKHDLDAQTTLLRTEMGKVAAEFRDELHSEIGGLRSELQSEIGGLRSELHAEVGGLRGELHAEVGGLRGEMHQGFSDVYKAMTVQTRTLMIGFVTSVVAMAGVMLAAVQLA